MPDPVTITFVPEVVGESLKIDGPYFKDAPEELNDLEGYLSGSSEKSELDSIIRTFEANDPGSDAMYKLLHPSPKNAPEWLEELNAETQPFFDTLKSLKHFLVDEQAGDPSLAVAEERIFREIFLDTLNITNGLSIAARNYFDLKGNSTDETVRKGKTADLIFTDYVALLSNDMKTAAADLPPSGDGNGDSEFFADGETMLRDMVRGLAKTYAGAAKDAVKDADVAILRSVESKTSRIGKNARNQLAMILRWRRRMRPIENTLSSGLAGQIYNGINTASTSRNFVSTSTRKSLKTLGLSRAVGLMKIGAAVSLIFRLNPVGFVVGLAIEIAIELVVKDWIASQSTDEADKRLDFYEKNVDYSDATKKAAERALIEYRLARDLKTYETMDILASIWNLEDESREERLKSIYLQTRMALMERLLNLKEIHEKHKALRVFREGMRAANKAAIKENDRDARYVVQFVTDRQFSLFGMKQAEFEQHCGVFVKAMIATLVTLEPEVKYDERSVWNYVQDFDDWVATQTDAVFLRHISSMQGSPIKEERSVIKQSDSFLGLNSAYIRNLIATEQDVKIVVKWGARRRNKYVSRYGGIKAVSPTETIAQTPFFSYLDMDAFVEDRVFDPWGYNLIGLLPATLPSMLLRAPTNAENAYRTHFNKQMKNDQRLVQKQWVAILGEISQLVQDGLSVPTALSLISAPSPRLESTGSRYMKAWQTNQQYQIKFGDFSPEIMDDLDHAGLSAKTMPIISTKSYSEVRRFSPPVQELVLKFSYDLTDPAPAKLHYEFRAKPSPNDTPFLMNIR